MYASVALTHSLIEPPKSYTSNFLAGSFQRVKLLFAFLKRRGCLLSIRGCPSAKLASAPRKGTESGKLRAGDGGREFPGDSCHRQEQNPDQPAWGRASSRLCNRDHTRGLWHWHCGISFVSPVLRLPLVLQNLVDEEVGSFPPRWTTPPPQKKLSTERQRELGFQLTVWLGCEWHRHS